MLVKHLAGRRGDPLDEIDLGSVAAGGEGQIGRRQFQRRDLRRAERDGGVGLQIGFDAHPVGELDDRFGARLHGKLRGDRIQRARQRFGECDRAVILALVVFRRPVADLDRRVVAHAVGPSALLERGHEDEGLEGRARLPARLGGAVELAVGIVIATHHRPHRSARVDGDERPLADGQLPALLVDQAADGLLGLFLEPQIDRGFHNDVALHVTDQPRQFFHHAVGEIVLRAGPVGSSAGGGPAHRGGHLAVADHALVAHGGQHHLRPCFGGLRVARRREPRGRLQ